MRYRALALDYDGTIACQGVCDAATAEALRDLRAAGRKLLLVTGRELPDLQATFKHLDLFERVVVENGALLYRPRTASEKALARPPAGEFIEELRARGVAPISVGRVIVATWQPHEATVLATIRDLGLELEVIFNKGAVMILPSGINKGTGLRAALREVGISEEEVVAVGDAENDHSFFNLCPVGVAVANAVPALKERADWVTTGERGAGVRELIAAMIDDDLAAIAPRAKLRSSTG